jgi:hypothetical protein
VPQKSVRLHSLLKNSGSYQGIRFSGAVSASKISAASQFAEKLRFVSGHPLQRCRKHFRISPGFSRCGTMALKKEFFSKL